MTKAPRAALGLALLANFLCLPASGSEPGINVAAFSRVVIPTSANVAGQGGSFFKTRLSILNVTSQSYSVSVLHYGNDGQTRTASISLSGGQIRNYDNFLQDVFQFNGAGAIVFDSVDSSRQFMVTAEVVNDLGSGKFKTVVGGGPLLEPSYPDTLNFSLGVSVDADSRTNLGIFNDSNSANTIVAEVYSSTGTLLTSVSFDNVASRTWAQKGLTGVTVQGGYILWRTQAPAYCWAVVVDNKSADGTFLPAADVLQ